MGDNESDMCFEEMNSAQTRARALRYVVVLMLFAAVSLSANDPNANAIQELPRGFREITFGLDREEVGALLIEDPNFNYRGDPDVQFLPRREQVVIDTAGFDFVSRGYFQFRDNELYSIIIKLDPGQMDYFSMFTQFSNSYGPPVRLSPQQAVWEQDGVRLALEKPLSVKYLDLVVFNEIREQGQMRESERGEARRNFLEQF